MNSRSSVSRWNFHPLLRRITSRENMNPVPLPDPENGTVDIEYNLVSKANDQIEFSAVGTDGCDR